MDGRKVAGRKKTYLSWSSGKDSAWSLYRLRQRPDIDVVGLFTTVNHTFQRVAMHAVRLELLKHQVESLGLPLRTLNIPHACSNDQYESVMRGFIMESRAAGIDCMAFGDLFLREIRAYRESQLKDSGITPIFPLWEEPTRQLANRMISDGLRAVITCVDPRRIPASFAGREYTRSFLEELPEGVDPCGENGEFHTFAVDGPMFNNPVKVRRGEIVERDGFVFADFELERA